MNRLRKYPYLIALVLLVLVFGGSVLVGLFVQNNPVSLTIDGYFYNLVANGPHFSILNTLVWPINNNFLHIGATSMPSYFVVLLGVFLLYLAFFNRRNLGWAFFSLFIASIIIGSIYKFDAHFIYRNRPYETLPNTFLNDSFKKALKGWNSYPSGHARDTAVYSVIIASYIPVLTIPMIIFSLFVGWSRVYVGAHFPSDALVGLLMGLVIGKVSLLLTGELKLIWKKFRKSHDKETK